MPAQVETALDDVMSHVVQDLAGPLSGPLQRIVGAAGKRLRPALTLAVAGLLGRRPQHRADTDKALHLAAAVELLHCATLVHDDLIDVASTRRGVPTLNAKEGQPAAVVGGDVLIAAATLLAGQVSQRAAVLVAQTFAALCQGEARQAEMRYDATVSTEALIEVAELKTGSLLRAACMLGAEAVDAAPAPRDAAATFGTSFGVCLQLVDDVLDIASTPALAGKPVGADFATGTLTLPAALAMAENPALLDLLRPDLDPVSRQRATNLLQHADGALATTTATARRYAREAREALSLVPRAAAGAASPALHDWPETFLDAQLSAKISDQHRWLAAQA